MRPPKVRRTPSSVLARYESIDGANVEVTAAIDLVGVVVGANIAVRNHLYQLHNEVGVRNGADLVKKDSTPPPRRELSYQKVRLYRTLPTLCLLEVEQRVGGSEKSGRWLCELVEVVLPLL